MLLALGVTWMLMTESPGRWFPTCARFDRNKPSGSQVSRSESEECSLSVCLPGDPNFHGKNSPCLSILPAPWWGNSLPARFIFQCRNFFLFFWSGKESFLLQQHHCFGKQSSQKANRRDRARKDEIMSSIVLQATITSPLMTRCCPFFHVHDEKCACRHVREWAHHSRAEHIRLQEPHSQQENMA